MTRRPAMITGAADPAVGELPGSTCMGLHAEAASLALADAGLSAGDIDGVLCAYSFTEPHLMLASVFCEYFGIRPCFSAPVRAGGATVFLDALPAPALAAASLQWVADESGAYSLHSDVAD